MVSFWEMMIDFEDGVCGDGCVDGVGVVEGIEDDDVGIFVVLDGVVVFFGGYGGYFVGVLEGGFY